MRTLFCTLVFTLAACTGTPERPPDDFVRAAESWEGLSAGAMMRRWGPPDVIEDNKATWRLGWRSIRCIDSERRRAPFGGSLSYTIQECRYLSLPHKCVVTAHFDSMQEVTEVTALSYRCADIYKHFIRVLDSGYPFNLYKYGDPGDAGDFKETGALR